MDLKAMQVVARGVATRVPFLSRCHRKRSWGGFAGSYYYSVWLRHLILACEAGLPTRYEAVAELGPGDTLGVGIAALLSGAESYYALDVLPFAADERNRDLLDELAGLFERRADVSGDFGPRVPSSDFPFHLLPDSQMERCLERSRIECIRRLLMDDSAGTDGAVSLRYFAPWRDPAVIREASVDLVLSQAVMEYFDDLPGAYQSMYRWLRPGGFMSHMIDLRCHGTASTWNGHWLYSDFVWSLIRGRRPCFINRLPWSAHERAILEAGFQIVRIMRNREDSTFGPERLPGHFTAEDAVTRSVFVQALKPSN